jgi:hypothetical protein
MHKAVAARLANSTLSLVEALRIGGFDYPAVVHDDHYILENDTVSLGQRKNQLSRRCRLAKQQANGETKPQKSKKQTNPEHSFSMDPSDDYPAESRRQKRELPLSEYDLLDEGEMQGIARQRMAKFHPQYHEIVVPQSHSNLGSLLGTNERSSSHLLSSSNAASSDTWPAPGSMFAAQSALADALRGPVTAPTSNGGPLLMSSSNSAPSHPSGVAVASLNATASSVGLTLEQLAVALSSTTNLAKVLADQTIPDMKQELALNLYRAECSTLYQRCMLLAGYDFEETKNTSSQYKQFAYKAWSAEGERLENQIGRMNSSPPTQPAASDEASEKVSAASLDHAHDHSSKYSTNEGYGDTSNEHDRGCFGGRHVHSLEGKCGHKAIIHQPDGIPAHIDFVVNGKVECYAGINPIGTNKALWPSRYNCEQLECPTDCPAKAPCECDSDCPTRVDTDPKEFHLSEINFDDKEWDQNFFANNAGNEDSLAGLMQLGSEEDGKTNAATL